MVALDYTISDKTVTATLTASYDIGNIKWTFSDGTSYYPASGSQSHTFAGYGTHSFTVRYTEYIGSLPTKSLSRTFSLVDPSMDDSDKINSLDIFRDKPIIIPAECTGDITITAIIEELPRPVNVDKTKMNSTVSSYVTFTDLEIGGGSTLELIITADEASGAEVSDMNLINLNKIPAFYTNGSVRFDYTIGETDDDDSNFDVKWDLEMMMASMPAWYEGNLSYDSEIFKNIICSDNSEAKLPGAAEYTSLNHTFNISSWSEIPPFVIDWYNDEKLGYAIKRAMLSPPTFKITIYNNLSSRVMLNHAKIVFDWSFNPTDIFMNMRTEGDKRKKQERIYTLPKGADATRLDGLDFPIFAVVDGYKKSNPPEVIKVYARWHEFVDDEDGGYYYPMTELLEPVEGMSGTDFATCLFKSSEHPLKLADFQRITDNGWMAEDHIILLTAPKIAESDHYRTIDVQIAEDKSADDQSAVFVINTKPNTMVDDQITAEDLDTYISKLHFFNTHYDFASTIEIPRSAIDPIFYDTLFQTYDSAPVLESIVGEPLYYINFSINKYERMVPIFHGRSLRFSDSLSNAADGVRSGTVFYMDGKTPNVINVAAPTKHKYKVKFKVTYDVYKHVYVIGADDIPGFKKDV